jgi:AcrR family transcriptional regulator
MKPARKARRRADPGVRRRGRPDASFSARAQILFGAASAFGAKGYADTAVEDVLKAARISRRTFYRFFRSKEDLFEELYEAASMVFLQSLRNAAALGAEPMEKLKNCLEVYLRAPQTAGAIFHVLQLEATRPGSKLAARRQFIYDALIEMLGDGIRAMQGRTLDPLILRGLIAANESISLHVFSATDGSEPEIQRAKQAMLHLMHAALDPDAPTTAASSAT